MVVQSHKEKRMGIGETTTTSAQNDLCPECGKLMAWTEGLLGGAGARGVETGRCSCLPCRIFMKPVESRDITKGKKMAENLRGVHFMDKKITKQSCAVQIGILRARQHCKTCDNSMGDPCTCNGKCNCLYCRDRRGED
jgi:hypothetical protein